MIVIYEKSNTSLEVSDGIEIRISESDFMVAKDKMLIFNKKISLFSV